METNIIVFYKQASATKIETKEQLIAELENLKESYLRLKENLLVRIYTYNVMGKREVRDFRRFALLALLKNDFDFTIERDVDFTSENRNYGKKLRYSTRNLQKRIGSKLVKRDIVEEFCTAITKEIRRADPLSEMFP